MCSLLHLGASLCAVRDCGLVLREIVQEGAQLLKEAKLESVAEIDCAIGLARLWNASAELRRVSVPWLRWDVFELLPPSIALSDRTNRFRTQRRTRVLVRERARVLLGLEMLKVGTSLQNVSKVRLFGIAFDFVGHLCLVGLDEGLCQTLLEEVLFDADFLLAVSREVGGNAALEESEEERKWCRELSRSAKECARELLFRDREWVLRSRVVAGGVRFLEFCAFCIDSFCFLPEDWRCLWIHSFAVFSKFVEVVLICPCVCLSTFFEKGTFVGRDWIFQFLKSKTLAQVRAALNLLFLGEMCGAVASLKVLFSVYF